MSTLLLRLAGPMQSWGTQSRFTNRDTGQEPSKSGVIGLLCAALGWPRSRPVDGLAAARMGVRVDREGSVMADYHTAGGTHRLDEPYGVARADGGLSKNAVVSRRYYLADADFLVGLESDDDRLLGELDQALAEPRWQLFLGRKAFVPGVPVRLPDAPPRGPGVVDRLLREALTSYPWFVGAERPHERRPEHLRLILESGPAEGYEARLDQPLGAAFADRTFTTRYVRTELVPLGEVVPIWES